MARLTFAAADVRRVVEHSLAHDQRDVVVDYDRETFESITAKPAKAAVLLVHDDGVYLMSNGTPRDIVEGDRSFVAYAKGCNPKTDSDWWDTSRALVGGDDFSETLEWASGLLALLDRGVKTVTLNFSATGISVAAPAKRRA